MKAQYMKSSFLGNITVVYGDAPNHLYNLSINHEAQNNIRAYLNIKRYDVNDMGVEKLLRYSPHLYRKR